MSRIIQFHVSVFVNSFVCFFTQIVLMARMKPIATTLLLVKRMNDYARVTKNVFQNRIGVTKIQIVSIIYFKKKIF